MIHHSMHGPSTDRAGLGVYVQVPFCQAKCSYCNFSTGVFRPEIYGAYADAVCQEIRRHAALYGAVGLRRWKDAGPKFAAETLYIGGGTPSLLDPGALARIVGSVREAFPGPLFEVTLEADPETITEEKARAWREAGFNRISLGAQSFDDAELKAVGRRHRRADIYSAGRALRGAGFENLSFDLIAGLPHQTRQSWQASVDSLVALKPEHISIYMLELDEGSRLGRESLAGGARYGVPALPDDDAAADFYEFARTRLAECGFEHYEISNWAMPGRCSVHNRKYWRRDPYLGFGSGAHSFDGVERWSNAHQPAAYVEAIRDGRSPIDHRELLDRRQSLEEELFLGMRQLEGIEISAIETRYQVALGDLVRSLAQEGLVEVVNGLLRLAASRLTVSNEVFVRLLG